MANSNRAAGFTLVELVITATFVALTSIAIIEIFVAVGQMNRSARSLAAANALADQKLETYRDAGYTAVPVGTPAETFTNTMPSTLGSPRSATSNVTVVHDGLKRVDVTISYSDGKKSRSVQASTFIAQRGISR